MNPSIVSIGTLAGIAALASGAFAQNAARPGAATPMFKGHELAARAVVSMDAARAIALKARPGVITDRELEAETGGSGLRYSFDIKSHGRTHEVGVDARTGRVLENKAEGANPD